MGRPCCCCSPATLTVQAPTPLHQSYDIHLHEQCHQLSGWGVVYLLYLLACALQYRYLNNIQVTNIIKQTAKSMKTCDTTNCHALARCSCVCNL
jgi:hypothetical protein